jgi:hypothetical protein
MLQKFHGKMVKNQENSTSSVVRNVKKGSSSCQKLIFGDKGPQGRSDRNYLLKTIKSGFEIGVKRRRSSSTFSKVIAT